MVSIRGAVIPGSAEDGSDGGHPVLKRRGLVAGAAALMAGLAAKRVSAPVEAATTFVLPNIETAGFTYSVAGPTTISATSQFQTQAGILNANPGTGANNAVGFHGSTLASLVPPPFYAGVHGSAGSFIGVHGKAYGTGTGVQGDSDTGSGVVGTSNSNVAGRAGGFFATSASGGSGVVGQIFGATTTSAAAFVGAAPAGNYAAFFTGTVVVNGALQVSGGGKSAVVKHPRTNDYRALYCEESPDSWFADYGSGKLVNGRADITLDPDFAALIYTDAYLVFLTPEGDTKGLYVATKSATGFAVREVQGGTSSLTFAYRVVGKRSDIKLERLAKVNMPTHTLPATPRSSPYVATGTPKDTPPQTAPPSRPASPTAPPTVQPVPQPRSG